MLCLGIKRNRTTSFFSLNSVAGSLCRAYSSSSKSNATRQESKEERSNKDAGAISRSQHKLEHNRSIEATQTEPAKASYPMSVLLGAAFGLMPCPSAMAAYFSGLSSGSPATAYIVIGLFAAGIATSLTLVGMIVQVFGSRFTNTGGRLSHLPWNYIRAGLITVIGLVYLGQVAAN